MMREPWKHIPDFRYPIYVLSNNKYRNKNLMGLWWASPVSVKDVAENHVSSLLSSSNVAVNLYSRGEKERVLVEHAIKLINVYYNNKSQTTTANLYHSCNCLSAERSKPTRRDRSRTLASRSAGQSSCWTMVYKITKLKLSDCHELSKRCCSFCLDEKGVHRQSTKQN